MRNVITSFQCQVCDKWKGTRHIDTTVKFPDDETSHHVCDTCVGELITNGHGRFDNATTLILHALEMDGGADTFMGGSDQGYVSQYGQYLLFCDTQGFWTSEEFPSIEAATKRFDQIHDEGLGAQEDDAYIYQDFWRGSTEVTFGCKHIAKLRHDEWENPLRRAKAIVSVEMRKQGFFPNVWLTDDRNIRRINVW